MSGMPGAVAGGAQRGDVLEALAAQGVRARDVEEVHADARGVQAHGVADRVVDDVAERRGAAAARRRRWRRRRAARGRACRGRAATAAAAPGRAVSWIASGAAVDERLDDRRHVLDAGQEARLAEEAVVDRDVDAAPGAGWKRRFRRYAADTADPTADLTTLSDHMERSRGRADRRPQPHDRPHAHDRRAASGRGAALRGRRRDAGRQGRQRRAGGARRWARPRCSWASRRGGRAPPRPR